MKTTYRITAALAATSILTALLIGCSGAGKVVGTSRTAAREAPQSMRMVWFGNTNWHYQIGGMGILLDGETKNDGKVDAASVSKALATLRRTGTVDVILIGHEHIDHSVQAPEWAKQTGKPVYAPAPVCAKLSASGIPAAQCTALKGGEKIVLDPNTSVHVVRWVHSVECNQLSKGSGGPETFGFLITANTGEGMLNVYVSDSGAGGPDLTTPRVANGVTYGSPLSNLRAAVKAAGLTHIDIWQGGPESRMVYQARTIVPAFDVRTFMPHHLNARANEQSRFDLSYGMHYPYRPEEQPKLQSFLASHGVPQVYPTNYFDAWEYRNSGLTKVENSAAKADWGLPPEGVGPGKPGRNPRAGQLECPQD